MLNELNCSLHLALVFHVYVFIAVAVMAMVCGRCGIGPKCPGAARHYLACGAHPPFCAAPSAEHAERS